ncbi:hypothetical protein UlMin_009587 [Ulmus minor]
MASSLSRSKLLVSSISDALSLSMSRRGYAVVSEGGSVGGGLGRRGSMNGMVGKVEERVSKKEDSEASSAWAPDPLTGYYRPGNRADEIDPVELRQMLLNNKVSKRQ